MEFQKLIEKHYPDVEVVCKSIYQNPEIALEEFESCKKVVALLKEKGFEVEEGYAGLPTAFKAVKHGGEGPRLMIPVEYDALLEIGHACGHHLICGMSLLAGLALGDVIEECGGEVALIGTPAEETGEGKTPMAQAGCFDEYDAAMMMHPASVTYANAYGTSIGVYDITFTGRIAHSGGAPYDGLNSLDAVVQMYNAVSMMRQQLRDGTRINGIILSGGTVINAIPDHCVIRYEIRTLTMDYYYHVADRLRKCAEAAALATGCEMKFELSMPICCAMNHSKALVKRYRELLAKYGYEENPEDPGPLTTDMGDVSQIVPSLHAMVKVSNDDEQLHTAGFLKASDQPLAWEMMQKHAAMLAELGYQVFTDKGLLEELRKEKKVLWDK